MSELAEVCADIAFRVHAAPLTKRLLHDSEPAAPPDSAMEMTITSTRA
jgi:hypothetical protein